MDKEKEQTGIVDKKRNGGDRGWGTNGQSSKSKKCDGKKADRN